MLLTKTPVAAATVPRQVRSFFEPTPDDLRLYRELSLRLRTQPPSSLFRYIPTPAGQHLTRLGDCGTWAWAAVIKAAMACWNDLPTGGKIAEDGTQLNSTPERILWEALRPVTPSDITLDVEPPIQIAAPVRFFSDLGIRFQDRVRYVEVVGACGADRVTRNEWEAHLLAQFDRRLEVYRQQRLTPEIWYLNDLLEPAQLQKRFLALVAQLRAGGGS
ncbi:hypothetical protein A0U94_08085 [Gluconobacter albidus]|uniref:hypothetical protein n=1 Tax=Gluconobacter albidus TaxID=318683 RepID=UPI0007C77D94|nr:hypothetical protein [Gluconobacter albidus]AQS90936.1 hypothetical protein A0U94_08085 [Gluconobacter albidus]OAG72797.1 hypothetical protein A0J51_02247 [Gluconobacter japonicus]